MAGEYQLAKKVLHSGLDSARDNDGMDEITFARALMYQLLEHNKKTREDTDIIGELEQHIRTIQDGGESVITRGD
jgi:hypothetical protein